MAVIITNMDMPGRCCDCDIYDACYYAITDSINKHPNCPLKSVDDMNGTPLPNNATNGDVIRAMFPKTIFIQEKRENKLCALMISDEWWNAPYTKEQTDEDKRDSKSV